MMEMQKDKSSQDQDLYPVCIEFRVPEVRPLKNFQIIRPTTSLLNLFELDFCHL